MALRQLQVELLPHPAVGLAREQGVAEHQALEGLGFALERGDDVPVVDPLAAPGAGHTRVPRTRVSTSAPGEILKEMGVAAVALPGGAIVPAAQRGVIDAAEWIGPADDLNF